MKFLLLRLQLHFQSVQRISDTATLPFVLPQLKTQLQNQLNLSALTEKLVQGKEVPRVLSGKEKIELWQELKTRSEIHTVFKPELFYFVLKT